MIPEFIRPNWHVILVHYPLGLLTVGVVIELLGFLWRRSSARVAARWMILIGALAAFPTATLGIYAYREAIEPRMDGTWREIVQDSSLSAEQWEMLNEHMWWNIGATAAMAAVAVSYLGASDRWRKKLHWPLVAAAVVGLACFVIGSWHGGEAVYRHGTGAEGPPRPLDSTEIAAIERFVPPYQLHMLLVGSTIAMALLALGLSIRRLSQPQLVAVTPANPDVPPEQIPLRPARERRAALAWVLGAAGAVGAALAGIWVTDVWNLRELWADEIAAHPRMLAHTILGVSIVVLLLALAGMHFWARRPKWTTVILASLLVLVVAAQVWMGVLLLYDSHEGPLTGWNPPGTTHSEH